MLVPNSRHPFGIKKNTKHIKMSSVKPDVKILERVSEQELEKYAQTAETRFVTQS